MKIRQGYKIYIESEKERKREKGEERKERERDSESEGQRWEGVKRREYGHIEGDGQRQGESKSTKIHKLDNKTYRAIKK